MFGPLKSTCSYSCNQIVACTCGTRLYVPILLLCLVVFSQNESYVDGYDSRKHGINTVNNIKAKITKFIEAKFIRQCQYAEWISNVVLVYKKNRKL